MNLTEVSEVVRRSTLDLWAICREDRSAAQLPVYTAVSCCGRRVRTERLDGFVLVAIHQPNFFPWLGWFDKLARADCMILLDHVPLQQTGGNYTNRSRVLVKGEPHWMTVPLARGTDARRRIDQAFIADQGNWRRKMVSTLHQSYAKAEARAETSDSIARVILGQSHRLCELNIDGLNTVASLLGLDTTRVVRSSSIPTEGASTALLVELVKAVGGTQYLTGSGASYQNDDLFRRSGVQVVYQQFRPAPYRQSGAREFVPGLSVIDALLNVGVAKTRALIGRAGEEG